MSKGWESGTADYIVDHRMRIDLSDAHRRSVADLQHDFNDEHGVSGQLHGISQGFAHEIHDIISDIFPMVDSLNVRLIRIEEMLDVREIRKMEGSMFQKVAVIAVIVASIADKVADALWEHQTGTDIDVALRDALAIGDEESKAVLEKYDALYRRVKNDFGL